MTEKRYLSLLRQAIDKYNMINENDCIAIGISGGKDSIAMFDGLVMLKKFYPKHFDIKCITVNLGINTSVNELSSTEYTSMDYSSIENYINNYNIEYRIINTDIYSIVFNERKEKNPCSLCSKLRKGAFNQAALDMGCNKIAYAHHKDEVIETLFMSLIYESQLHTFSPITHLDKTNLDLIRPLIYVSEKEIISYVNNHNLPILKNLCPADGYTKREYIKNLIYEINGANPGMKNNALKAIEASGIDGW